MASLDELPDAGTPVRSERARVRRAVLRDLREIADGLRGLINVWDVGRRIWDGHNYREAGTRWAVSRWRRWGEYPENNPARLRASAARARSLGAWLRTMADELEDCARDAEAVIRQREIEAAP